MSATRLWSPIARPAPFWLKPLPRNACSPVADGAAPGTCVRLPTAATAAGRWLPSRGRCPHWSRPRRLGSCGDRSPALAWAADGLCPVPWKAAPWTCEAPHGAEHVPVHQLWVWVFRSPRSHPQLVYDEPGIRRIVQNTGVLCSGSCEEAHLCEERGSGAPHWTGGPRACQTHCERDTQSECQGDWAG